MRFREIGSSVSYSHLTFHYAALLHRVRHEPKTGLGQGGSPSGGGGGGGLGQAMGTGARFAANMGSNLAKGGMAVAKAGAGGRVSQTPGGKVASAIRANMEQPEFTGNRFAHSTETTVDREAETEAFVNSKP